MLFIRNVNRTSVISGVRYFWNKSEIGVNEELKNCEVDILDYNFQTKSYRRVPINLYHDLLKGHKLYIINSFPDIESSKVQPYNFLQKDEYKFGTEIYNKLNKIKKITNCEEIISLCPYDTKTVLNYLHTQQLKDSIKIILQHTFPNQGPTIPQIQEWLQFSKYHEGILKDGKLVFKKSHTNILKDIGLFFLLIFNSLLFVGMCKINVYFINLLIGHRRIAGLKDSMTLILKRY